MASLTLCFVGSVLIYVGDSGYTNGFIGIILAMTGATCFIVILPVLVYMEKKEDLWRRGVGPKDDQDDQFPDNRNEPKRLMQNAMRELDDYLSGEALRREIEGLVRKARAVICTALQVRCFVTIKHMRASGLFALLGIFIFAPVWAASSGVVIYPLAPFQGETVVVSFSENSNVVSSSFNGRNIPVFIYKGRQTAVFGVSPTQVPGVQTFSYLLQSGETKTQSITVRSKSFPKLVLGIPKELGITSNQLVQNLAEQKTSIQKTLEAGSAGPLFTGGFGLPLYDNRKITSVFGEIRKTGTNEIRHLGVDFGGRLGAAVAAINNGRVASAYFDPVYGNSVIVDHGAGIFSLYLHLNDIRVKEGEVVKKGKVVGGLGKTGYSTSPHLHLSLKVGGVSVDPLRFVSAFSKL